MVALSPVQWLQIMSGAAWLCFLVILMPCFVRVIRGKGDQLDAFRIPLWFTALTQVWFIVRWIIWAPATYSMGHNELQGWAIAYVGNTISALSLIASNHYAQRFR